MSAIIKPEIYISWVPVGKILLAPQILATYIPAPIHKKILADLSRKISANESVSVDTLRQVGQGEKTSADTKRAIIKTEKVIGDTSRKIGVTLTYGDLKRNVKSRVKNNFDICRQVAIKEKSLADTKCIVSNHEKISAHTLLQITATEKTSADLFLKLREIFRADTKRIVTRQEKTRADVIIRIPHVLNYIVKPKVRAVRKNLLKQSREIESDSSLVSTFEDYNVTAINITLNEKTLSDNFTFEIADKMNINEEVQGQLLDYPFHFLVEETNQKDLIQSVKGKYNVDELLYTWFQMPYYNNSDESDDEETETESPTAIQAVTEIVGDLGLEPEINIDDFTPTNLSCGELVTYADVLSSIFGWTSRVPTRQINVFIRNEKLFCIQRGKETSSFDITKLPHTRPTINKKFNRVLCHNPAAANADDDKQQKFSGILTYLGSNISLSFHFSNGLLKSESITMSNRNKYNTSSTNYSYNSWAPSEKDELQFYLASKNITNTTTTSEAANGVIGTAQSTETVTEKRSIRYDYSTTPSGKERYLLHEYEDVTKTTTKKNTLTNTGWQNQNTSSQTSTENHDIDTVHVPLGNGFYATVSYRDGEPQGGTISQGAPGNSVSPYMVEQTQKNLIEKSEDPNDIDDQLSAIVDDSFPVQEKGIKNALNEELKRLHGKTVETVTVDLVSKIVGGIPEITHIVDFTDKVKLDDGEYFLVSNNISFTPRKFIQKLQLIRWI